MDERAISIAETKALFGDLADAPALILAISGGPDSTALLMLAARWRAGLKAGPKLLAITVDHRLRPESAREAKDVARLARKFGVAHRTLRWSGAKPKTGLQAAARQTRYGLLAKAARSVGASHVLTAHTRDDQAETVLIRLTRGSGLAGLGAMARISPLPLKGTVIPGRSEGPGPESITTDREYGFRARRHPSRPWPTWTSKIRSRVNLRSAAPRNDYGWGDDADNHLHLVRPLLDLPKSRLIATLKSARIRFADDPSNRNPQFTRVRIRELIPALAQEGLTSARLSVLARRLARANTGIERAVDEAYHDLLQIIAPGPLQFDVEKFRRLPEEIALRLLGRAIAERGDEGPVELGKLENLHAALPQVPGSRFSRTLAGALVTIDRDRLLVDRAPPRRPQAKRLRPLTKHKGGRRKVSRRR